MLVFIFNKTSSKAFLEFLNLKGHLTSDLNLFQFKRYFNVTFLFIFK